MKVGHRESSEADLKASTETTNASDKQELLLRALVHAVLALAERKKP